MPEGGSVVASTPADYVGMRLPLRSPHSGSGPVTGAGAAVIHDDSDTGACLGEGLGLALGAPHVWAV